jgi:tRNA-specific adenosine deaminase 1
MKFAAPRRTTKDNHRTGMKCLPASKLPLNNGVGLHDWHAEVLAIRSFNHFVLEECKNIAITGKASTFLRLRDAEERRGDGTHWHAQPFAWRDGVKLHMYCSEAPCKLFLLSPFMESNINLTVSGGDASMELTMEAQQDASPWALPSPQNPADPSRTLPGRGYFSELGVIRRKPARGDAPPSLSKSCSDKLALKQCTSLLSSLTSLLVCPDNVYLQSVVLPESQRSLTGCRRSFSVQGRMNSVAGSRWPGGYSFAPFEVETTSREFAFSKRSVALRSDKTIASNLAVAWTMRGLDEGIIGGFLQGRKAFDFKGASLTSRRKMWALALELAGMLGAGCVGIQRCLSGETYKTVKTDNLLVPRRQAKANARAKALAGWTPNEGDDNFGPMVPS